MPLGEEKRKGEEKGKGMLLGGRVHAGTFVFRVLKAGSLGDVLGMISTEYSLVLC